MKPRHAQKGRKGLVLFELLIALFLFVLVGFALVMALDAGLKANRLRNQTALVTQGLNNQLALLHNAQLAPCDRDLAADGSKVNYHLVVQPDAYKDQKGETLANLYLATITAHWTSDGQAETRSVNEVIYQP